MYVYIMCMYILCVYIYIVYISYIHIHIISFHRHGVAGHDCHVLRRLAWSHRGGEGAAAAASENVGLIFPMT